MTQDWKTQIKNREKTKSFCTNLTEKINNEDIRKNKYYQCLNNPLKFIEDNYREEICLFSNSNNPNIKNLIDCRKTKNIINLMAKEKEGFKSLY